MQNSDYPSGGMFLLETTDPRSVFIPEDFSAEDRLIGKTAEDFINNEVMPHIERIEKADHDLMRDLMKSAGHLGLLGGDVPEVYGGLGLSQMAAALISEKLNPQQSFALTHEAHGVIGTFPLLYFGSHEQKSRYLPKLASGEWIASFALSEANSGSDALAMQTKAVLSPDGKSYILNGVKMWITNSAFADLFTVFAKVDGSKITAFLVERGYPGVSFGKEEHKLGMHGTSTRRVILENVEVPVENAMEVGKGHYAAFCALNLGRFKLEAGAVGGLKATVATCASYAKQRKTFGKPIGEYGLIKHKLAEMCARTFALESMVYRLAGDLESVYKDIVPDASDASTHYHRASEEFAIECNIVKVIGSETYSSMTDEAIQIHGGYGYTEEFPVARAWRDQRLLRIGEGANEIVRIAIVNTFLRREKGGRLTLKDAGMRASHQLSQVEMPETSFSDDPLDTIGELSRDVKQLALFLLFQTKERLQDDILESQEIVAAIADVICSSYALESIWLRAMKLRGSNAARYETILLAAQVAAMDYSEDAAKAARYALDSLPPIDDVVDWRDEPFTGLSNLLNRLLRREVNPMRLRRELADKALERNGYPLT